MTTKTCLPRVLFIGPVPPPYSGPEIVTRMLLDSDLINHFDIHFIRTNVRKSNEDKGRLDHKMISSFFVFFSKLLVSLVLHRPRIVYYPVTATATGWFGRDIWCLYLSALFRAKIVIHLHAGHFKQNFAGFPPFLKRLVSYSLRFVSLALVLGESLRDQFSGLIPDARIRVLHNPINTSEYQDMGLRDCHAHAVLFMGHMTQAKGYCDAVKAIPLVAKEVPDVKFYFAGTLRQGERGVFCNQITGAKLLYADPLIVHRDISGGLYRDNYVYCGVVYGDQKMALLRQACLFISPSYSEGLSLSLLEALAAGKAVVCTPVGAHKDFIGPGQNGFLIAPGDYRSLAGYILTILKDENLRRKMAHANIRLAEDYFDNSKIARRLTSYFYECLQ